MTEGAEDEDRTRTGRGKGGVQEEDNDAGDDGRGDGANDDDDDSDSQTVRRRRDDLFSLRWPYSDRLLDSVGIVLGTRGAPEAISKTCHSACPWNRHEVTSPPPGI